MTTQQPPTFGANANKPSAKKDKKALMEEYIRNNHDAPFTVEGILGALKHPDPLNLSASGINAGNQGDGGQVNNNNNLDSDLLDSDLPDDDLPDADLPTVSTSSFRTARDDPTPTSAKTRHAAASAAAAALRHSKALHNPNFPPPDTPADADGVALGVIPSLPARRWRERRMRIARYVHFLADSGEGEGEGANIDEGDVPAPLAKFLDLDFRRDEALWTAPVVKGGKGRGGVGTAYVEERPGPGGWELRRRRAGPVGRDLTDDDWRALDELYAGIRTPEPIGGWAGRKGGGAVAAPPAGQNQAQPPPPPPQQEQQQQQQQQQQQPLSGNAVNDPAAMTRLPGLKRGKRPAGLDFAQRRSPRRAAVPPRKLIPGQVPGGKKAG